MDLLSSMQSFLRAADRGSFSAAARNLRVTQPHITRAVQQLEARLGARLFHRSTRRLTLTDEGREYLERCRAVLAAVAEADESVGTHAQSVRGELRVFAPVSLGRLWVVPRLTEFLEHHPALTVNLVLDDRPRDLVAEGLDIGLRIGPLPDTTTLRLRKLGDVQRLVVAAPNYWARNGYPQSPDDLGRYEWLIFDGTIRVDRLECVRGSEKASVPLKGRFSTNSSEAILEALVLGQGACLVPHWLVARALKSGALESVLHDWTAIPHLPLFATYPETRIPTEKVRRFVDWLAFSLQADGLFVSSTHVAQQPPARH